MDFDDALLLRPVAAPSRKAVLDLFASGGWSRDVVRSGVRTGTLLELYDPADLVPRGAAVVCALDDGSAQLCAWVVAGDISGTAATSEQRLLQAVADRLRRSGCVRLLARPASSRVGALEAAGFVATTTPPPGLCDGCTSVTDAGADCLYEDL